MMKMCIGLHVKYRLLLSDFNETWIFSAYFRKIPTYQILKKIRSVGAELFHTDGRTDMTKIIVACRNFTNAPRQKKKKT